MVVSPNLHQRRPPSVPSIEVLSPWKTAWPGLVEVMSPANDHCDETPLLNVSTPSSDAGEDNIERSNEYLYKKTFSDECHVSNITVVTDTTETDNVTSISIEHETGTFFNQEHDNKV